MEDAGAQLGEVQRDVGKLGHGRDYFLSAVARQRPPMYVPAMTSLPAPNTSASSKCSADTSASGGAARSTATRSAQHREAMRPAGTSSARAPPFVPASSNIGATLPVASGNEPRSSSRSRWPYSSQRI